MPSASNNHSIHTEYSNWGYVNVELFWSPHTLNTLLPLHTTFIIVGILAGDRRHTTVVITPVTLAFGSLSRCHVEEVTSPYVGESLLNSHAFHHAITPFYYQLAGFTSVQSLALKTNTLNTGSGQSVTSYRSLVNSRRIRILHNNGQSIRLHIVTNNTIASHRLRHHWSLTYRIPSG